MSQPDLVSRRDFLNKSVAVAAAGAVGAVVAGEAGVATPAMAQAAAPAAGAAAAARDFPLGVLGKAKISRMMLGGNLISGYLHCRDLQYVGSLFRAYVTEEKMMQTLSLAEKCGINTVFETGANFVQKYNKEFNGKMQFIPHIQVKQNQEEQELKDHIQRQVDQGAVALYVWGVASDELMRAGRIDRVVHAVELAKKHGLPVGVGSHSLLVPMECEKLKAPCDFYVKTLHNDDYPSATPKELRKEFIWLNGGKGWYDNMWCINPQETIDFMKSVEKPWIAFKVLAAGAYKPQQGFDFAFKNGADFIAVGMFDFQVVENCNAASKIIGQYQKRSRPWRA